MIKFISKKIAAHLSIALMLALGLNTGSLAQSNTKTPEETTKTFYQWYTNDNTHPDIYKPKGTPLEELVSQALLKKLQQDYKKGLIDTDYFTKTQDNLEDWATNVNIEKTTKLNKNQVMLLVSLGKTKETTHKLQVTLTQETNLWKITKVTQIAKK